MEVYLRTFLWPAGKFAPQREDVEIFLFLLTALRSALFPPHGPSGDASVKMESPDAIFVVTFTEMLTRE